MANKAAGTSLKIISGGSEYAVGSLTRLSGFTMQAGEYETTTLGGSDGFRTYGQGLKDAGELTAEGFFDPNDINGQMSLKGSFESGDARIFAIVFPSGSRFQFNGFVKAWGIGEITPDGLQTFKAVLRLSGKPSFVSA